MPNGHSGAKKGGTLSQYDKGYRDGLLEGLEQCGPIAGFTQWFKRRAVSKKLGEMKAAERQAVVAEALAQYEAEGHGAKKRLLANPSKKSHQKSAAINLRNAKLLLRDAKAARTKESRFKDAMAAATIAQSAAEHSLDIQDLPGIQKAMEVRTEAENIIRKLCDLPETNPSQAGSAALGGVAGGLLLGPLGAAAGAYGGVKLKQRAEGKKRTRSHGKKKAGKRKKNPQVGRLMSVALK